VLGDTIFNREEFPVIKVPRQCPLVLSVKWLMLFAEITAASSDNYIKPTNALCGQNAEFTEIYEGWYTFLQLSCEC
jgi:hypothetical protein